MSSYDLSAAAAGLDKSTLALIRRVLCSHAPPSTPLEELLPRMTASAEVDCQLFALVALVCRDFVMSWYTRITDDTQLVQELVRLVGSVVGELERRVGKIDLELLLLDELPVILETHITDYRLAQSRHGTSLAPNLTVSAIFHNLQPHPALATPPSSERLYLRLVASGILAVLLPVEDLQSDCERALVREILGSMVLGGMVDRLSEPWMVYEIVTKLLGLLKDEGAQKGKEETEREGNEREKNRERKKVREKENNRENEKENENEKKPINGDGRRLRRSSTATSKLNGTIPSEKRPPPSALPPPPSALPPPPPPSPPSHPYPALTIPPALDTLLTLITRILSLLRTFFVSLLHTLHTPAPPQTRTKPLLRMSIFSLIATFLRLPSLQPWLLGNLLLLSSPLTTRTNRAGAVLDNLLSSAIRSRLSPSLLVTLLKLARNTLFPNNGPMPPGRTPPSATEQKQIRKDAELALVDALPERIRKLWFGDEESSAVAARYLDVFEDKEINKHLLYNVLDLLVGRLVPELVEFGPAELRRSRVHEAGV